VSFYIKLVTYRKKRAPFWWSCLLSVKVCNLLLQKVFQLIQCSITMGSRVICIVWTFAKYIIVPSEIRTDLSIFHSFLRVKVTKTANAKQNMIIKSNGRFYHISKIETSGGCWSSQIWPPRRLFRRNFSFGWKRYCSPIRPLIEESSKILKLESRRQTKIKNSLIAKFEHFGNRCRPPHAAALISRRFICLFAYDFIQFLLYAQYTYS